MMAYQYWLLLGSLALGAGQIVACSSPFSSCEAKLRCPAGGASGMAGAAGADDEEGEAGAEQGGNGGLGAQAGRPGIADDAGASGMAGEPSVETELEIAEPTLAAGKTYVPFTAKLSASGAAHYEWSVASGTLPAGLALQGAQSASVTIAGTPTEAGQFPLTLRVADGLLTKTVDVTLVITHSALFLSDRDTTGVNELFLTEIGGASGAKPLRLSASLPAGGNVSTYAWSPDGSKVLYLARQSSGGAEELWVASLAKPGTAQRVSAPGVNVSRMVWLTVGNVGAYMTNTGIAYLVDLSGTTPGASKEAVQESTYEPGTLLPSPNGTSLLVGTSPPKTGALVYTYVSWAAGTPKSVPVATGQTYAAYSYDGRFAFYLSSGIGWWSELSFASVTDTSLGWSFSGAWSPNSQVLLYSNRASSDDPAKLFRGTFDSGSLTSTALVSSSACTSMSVSPWSPDGRHGVFSCDRDLRAVANVPTAAINADFSLLPTGFSANAFTDSIQNVRWSSDSNWIALRADRDADARYDLQLIRWSAPGVTHKPHANSTASGVATWAFAPNSQSIAFVGTIAPQSNDGLYVTKLPPSGAPPTATLVSTPAGAAVQTDLNWLPGSRVITYRAAISGAAQLYAVPVSADGTAGSPVSVSGASGSGVSSYQLAPIR
jgi:putative Ig domain-containing protein/WD40 repeat protein